MVTVPLAGFFLTGCGGGDGDAPAANYDEDGMGMDDMADDGGYDPADDDAAMAADMEGAGGLPGDDGGYDADAAEYDYGEGAGGGRLRQPPVPELPEDVARWTPDNFKSAVETGHPKLVEAVEHVAGQSKGDPAVAALLTQILENLAPKAEGPPAQGGTGLPGTPGLDPTDEGGATCGDDEMFEESAGNGPAGASHAELLRSLTVAPPSVAVLARPRFPLEVLAGYQPGLPGGEGDDYVDPAAGVDDYNEYDYGTGAQRKVQDAAAVVKAVIGGLAKNDTIQGWQTMQRLLRGEIETGVADEQVVDWVLAALMENYGGRTHVTHQLLTRCLETPQALRPLHSDDPAKLHAQQLQQRALAVHAEYLSSALDTLLGVPAQPAEEQRPRNQPGGSGLPGGAESDENYDVASDGLYDEAGGPQRTRPAAPSLAAKSLSPEELQRVVNYMWRPEFIHMVEDHTRRMSKPEENLEFLTLAASLPDPSIRSTVYRLFNKNADTGIDALLEQQYFSRLARDPGQLVVLKSMPRLEPGQNRPSNERALERFKARESWSKAHLELVRALNARFYAASQNALYTGVANEEVPFRLHKDAQVAAEYHASWPAGVEAQLPEGQAARMMVHYVRVNMDSWSNEVYGHYFRQFKKPHILDGKKVLFFDPGLQRGHSREYQRSIDVIITDLGGGSGGSPEAAGDGIDYGGTGGSRQQSGPKPGNYRLELLVVEVPNPTVEPETTAQTDR